MGRLCHPLGKELHSLPHTLRGLHEPFSLWVFTKERKNLGVMILELFVFCHQGGAYGYSSVALGST